MTPCRATVFLVTVLLAAGTAHADERTFTLDPARTMVVFTLDATLHQVHGALVVSPATLRLDPAAGTAAGDITVDLREAKTGNSMRDRTMHEEVLETGRYPRAVFHAARLTGALAPAGTSRASLEGVLTFHGADHPMTLPLAVTVSGTHVSADASVEIPYVAWGLHDPSVLLLRVAKVVNVRIRAEGELSTPLTSAR